MNKFKVKEEMLDFLWNHFDIMQDEVQPEAIEADATYLLQTKYGLSETEASELINEFLEGKYE